MSTNHTSSFNYTAPESSSDYRRIADRLVYSRDNFQEVEYLFQSESFQPPAQQDETGQLANDLQAALPAEVSPTQEAGLKQRWQTVLTQGSELAQWVQQHHRTQSTEVKAALEELVKYADVRRPFRLSVIGQKGVGKSALVNALLGASGVQYTPSEVAGKAVSGTRIRLIARPTSSIATTSASRSNEVVNTINPEKGLTDAEGLPTWRIVFLTPRRLWEVGSFLLNVARLEIPAAPADRHRPEVVCQTLEQAMTTADVALQTTAEASRNPAAPLGSASQIQATSALDILSRMLAVYRRAIQSQQIPPNYVLGLDDPNVDGPVSPYLRQTEDDLYLIVDYVERYLAPEEAGFLAGRRIELEDVLGLDDPRDSFFALEAFREAFAVVMVFKCDRGLNTEASSLLQSLFSRNEQELARFGEPADLNKAILVANQFDSILANVAAGGNKRVGQNTGNPLKGIEDIRRELSRYTRQPVPLYLTSASIAQVAQDAVTQFQAQAQTHNGAIETQGTGLTVPVTLRTTPAYNYYLDGLANLLTGVEEPVSGKPIPDYLDFIVSRRAEIETLAAQDKVGDRDIQTRRAQLILELSGLLRLSARVEEALESGSILRGRVANAEYYYTQALGETAKGYARQMGAYRLELADFSQPPASLESRLFARFQHETRQKLENLDEEFKKAWFELSRQYIYGPQPKEIEQLRRHFLDTIKRAISQNRQLIRVEEHISTGQFVTDAWRKVFEDLNDWLALEAGRQFRGLVGPLLVEIERLTAQMQQRLTLLAATSTLDEAFWPKYRARLGQLRERLQTQAEVLAIGYYTDHRCSIYDPKIAETLHVGDAKRRREEVIWLLQAQVESWFNPMWQLLARVAMTDLNNFVAELRYRVLGLDATDSLLVGLELTKPGSSQLSPDDSLYALLNQRYHQDEQFRRQYAMREPSPAERLTLEIRDWLALVYPPLDGLVELGKALTIVGSTHYPSQENDLPGEDNDNRGETGQSRSNGVDHTTNREQGTVKEANTYTDGQPSQPEGYSRLRIPVESLHPFASTTRQFWDITNPDDGAEYTRLHFRRINLGAPGNPASLTVEGLGHQRPQTITGQQLDYWTEPLPGRRITVRFIADQAQPDWGFALVGLDSRGPEEVSRLTRLATGASR